MKKIVKLKNLTLIFTIFSLLCSFILFPIKINAESNTTNSNILLTNENNSFNNVQNEEIEILGYLGEDNKTRNSPGNIVNQIMNNTFYIKNAYSGRYLDVYRGIATDGTNVQQCSFNGGNNQKWYISYNNDGTFTFFPAISNNYALDVYGASSDNFANIDIWSYHGGDSQKFKIGYTSTSTYVILTKMSNYEKSVVVHANGCSDEDNVNQFTFSGNWNELWILEPVNKNVELGAKYALDNYNQTVFTYPRCEQDCTNFVSQCLLASGIHYTDNWKIYRKNGFYTNVSHNYQLEYSWDVSVPGPWLGAQEFRDFWVQRISEAYICKGSAITANPSIVWEIPVTQGCVVQIANYSTKLEDSFHTMYVTGYLYDGTNNTYLLTYHTNDTLSESLISLASKYPNQYFVFLIF